MSGHLHRLTFPLAFPAGLRPGEGKHGNQLTVARDGEGRPVLRGTALAGALRHAWANSHQVRSEDLSVTRWFGSAAGEGVSSPLRVSNTVMDSGPSSVRTHIARNRHSGAVLEGGLVEIESLPPGTRGKALLTLDSTPDETANACDFLRSLVGIIDEGLTLGGNAARGLGRARFESRPLLRTFDLSSVAAHAAWLDEAWHWRAGTLPSNGEEVAQGSSPGHTLRVLLKLAVPRGQDLLVGDGQGMDHEAEPQRVTGADGKTTYWRLPGSTLRGALRAWINRLAAREGYSVADSLRRHRHQPDAGGAEAAYGFVDRNQREGIQDRLTDAPETLTDEVPCPVMRLFGSGFSKGRLHVSDGLSDREEAHEQMRRHVAVDRVSGGANEGLLFDDVVVTKATFEVAIALRQPTEQESRWLGQAVQAIHLGLIRIGSSKSSGRLALAHAPAAEGPCAKEFSSAIRMEI